MSSAESGSSSSSLEPEIVSRKSCVLGVDTDVVDGISESVLRFFEGFSLSGGPRFNVSGSSSLNSIPVASSSSSASLF